MHRSISHMMVPLSLMVGVATVAFAAGWHSSQALHAGKASAAAPGEDVQASFAPIAAAGAHFRLVAEPKSQRLASTTIAFNALRDLKQARAIENSIGAPAKRPAARKRSCVKTGE